MSAPKTGGLPFVLDGVHIEPRTLPIASEISLYLIQDDYPGQSLGSSDSSRLMDAPPYWAFCWGGGQALARWILDNPQAVRGRAVLDFGAGSGVAGIAAAKSGAARVMCVDVDQDALLACEHNGKLNSVQLETSTSCCLGKGPLLLAADVCYEEQGFSAVIEHMLSGGDIIIAESRLRDLSERFSMIKKVGEYRVRTFPDLDESENYDSVHIFCSYKLAKIL